jgi:hypothetical protein
MEKKMDREDILELLRDSLSVEIDIGYDYDYGWDGRRVKVVLKLDGDIISETSDSLPERG